MCKYLSISINRLCPKAHGMWGIATIGPVPASPAPRKPREAFDNLSASRTLISVQSPQATNRPQHLTTPEARAQKRCLHLRTGLVLREGITCSEWIQKEALSQVA